MDNVFSKICKKCSGECCHFDLFLSKKDISRLRGVKHYFKLRKRGAGFTLKKNNRACPFLRQGSGCVLKENQKPLDCRLFPLAFKIKQEKITFRSNKDCSLLDKIPKSWFTRTKKQALRELKHWSKEEKKSFSRCVGNHPELIPA